MARYAIERVAKNPQARRIKDTLKGRYLKMPHGSEIWPWSLAYLKRDELTKSKEAP